MDDIRVALVNQGSSTEDPWTLAQFQARDLVERTFAGRVRATFVEKVEPGPSAVETVCGLVDSGHDLIVATSAPLAADILQVAPLFTETAFEQARGSVATINVSTYTGTHEQSAFLAGLAAGGVSTSGRIAYVAPVFESETLRILNGFAHGVETAHPGSTVLAAWTDVWWDPPAERRAAELLLDAGADVVATGCTSTATGELSLEHGLPWCGQDADLSDQFGAVWVTAPMIRPGGHYCRRVLDRIEGRWRSQAYVGDLADGFTDIAPLGLLIPAEVRCSVMKTRSRMLEGVRIPALGFPAGPEPPARPVEGVPLVEWCAATHLPNVQVLLPPPSESPTALRADPRRDER